MARRPVVVFLSLLCLGAFECFAQSGESPIETFGYFQITFEQQESTDDLESSNSFSVQQLNLILRKEFSQRWLAYVNFEVLNNFSSSRRWGSFDLDEAWVRYRARRSLVVKAGLHVPVFNHLNDIKNRTPLLPYVIRPLIYEESFAEFIEIEEFVPDRAFAQINGSTAIGTTRLDYATYIGNSPNISSHLDFEMSGDAEQTGIDTTGTVMVGGRVGLRRGEVKLGVSSTYDQVNSFRVVASLLRGVEPGQFNGEPRVRLGADLSFRPGKFSFEGEVIVVRYGVEAPPEVMAFEDGRRPVVDLDRDFYYGTLGYDVTERLFVYGSYWFTEQGFRIQVPDFSLREQVDIEVFTAGVRYRLLQDESGLDRITVKAQYAFARLDISSVAQETVNADQNLHLFGLAVSVLF